ncbi:hypothetical protein AMELA_G00230530, partial [Ameiurus melas]
HLQRPTRASQRLELQLAIITLYFLHFTTSSLENVSVVTFPLCACYKPTPPHQPPHPSSPRSCHLTSILRPPRSCHLTSTP